MSFESYQTLKSLHIIFMVSWFAGLFYIVRLYIYHTEAQQKDEVEKGTLCLVAIVFIVEMGNGMNWLYGTIGFFGVAIGLMIGIRIYKLLRKRNAQR